MMQNLKVALVMCAVVIAGAFSLSLDANLATQGGQQAPPEPMSFFVTSVGMGDGANLGGLDAADAHCQMLAEAAGRGDSTWHAYLSTQGSNAVNARDRIGSGPGMRTVGAAASRRTSVRFMGTRSSRPAWGTPLVRLSPLPKRERSSMEWVTHPTNTTS